MFNCANIHLISKIAPRISFCLYGQEANYYIGAIHNAVISKTVYPGWICRFYVQYVSDYCQVLIDLGCEVIQVLDEIKIGLPHPQLWRLSAINDSQSPYTIFRDTDSLLNAREKAAVDDWISSKKSFHRMKEYPHILHLPLLGGMWGMTYGALPSLSDLANNHVFKEDPAISIGPTFAPQGDMPFLNHKIWPIMANDVLFHGSSNDRWGKALPFPSHKAIQCEHVGSYVYRSDWLTRARLIY